MNKGTVCCARCDNGQSDSFLGIPRCHSTCPSVPPIMVAMMEVDWWCLVTVFQYDLVKEKMDSCFRVNRGHRRGEEPHRVCGP